jgi:CO/xanthine dehydrogenase FAD-binding subunit
MQLRPDELVVKIHLPRPHAPLKQYARKVGTRKAQAISKVCFNAAAEMDSSKIKSVRIAIGSVAPIPLRCHKVEAALTGQLLNQALFSHARELIAKEIRPIDDIRSTSQYRSLVTQNLLGEFLGQLL